jgi:flagellar biosynthesis protein FliQ
MSNDAPHLGRNDERASIGEVVEYVKTYARQETVGPLKGAGTWVAFGAAGALCLGIGLSLLLLGLLRVLQAEVSDIADGRLSWLPYLIVLVVCVALIAVALMQVNKTFLNKEDQR